MILAMGILGTGSPDLGAQDRFPVRQLTFDPAQEGFATWSPDGKKLAFTSTRTGSFDIWIMDVDLEELKKNLQLLP